MSRNYGIRYPYNGNPRDNETNNYGAWIPERLPVGAALDEDNGKHYHELIPKDYVPKKNQIMEE